jgi:glycogen phosphorylase
MIESINFQTGISASLLRTAQAALTEIPYKFHAPSRHTPLAIPMRPQSLPRTLEKNRYQWVVDTELVTIEPQVQTTDLDLAFNPRQWLLLGNPRLANSIAESIGDRWITHLEDLQQLVPLADDPSFQSRWRAVKQANKQALANELYRDRGINLNVNSLFDLQLQSIDSPQRQLLNILHIISLFNRIKQQPDLDILPRTFIFADLGELAPVEDVDEADALPNRNLAILALIQSLAEILAADPDVNGKLQIVYIPEAAALTNQLYAAADLTQQIATATIEDVDLSSLKAAVNGVLSIGSLGKTNHWVRQIVGEDNYFGFGLAIPEIALFKQYGYDPYNYYKYYPEIRQTIDALLLGYFTPNDPMLGRVLVDTLLGADDDMVLADYIFYAACQARVSEVYRQKSMWTQMSILNVAGVG